MFLPACQNNNSPEVFTFTGEGENWTVSQEVTQSENGKQSKIKIEYIGHNFEEAIGTTIHYTFIYLNGGSFYGNQVLDENGIIEDMSGRTGRKIYENEEIQVEIGEYGKEERFMLNAN